MLKVRQSQARGHANHGWLDSYHSFSFADYYDPGFSGFHDLLVINEDQIAAGTGFGTHGHRDMEIITYVLKGSLEHKDSMGTGSVLHYGDVQRMSAGTGVRHSEFNHSKTHPLHLLQIWITPSKNGIPPSYEEKKFSPADKLNQLCLIVSPDGARGSLTIHQDTSVYAAILEKSHQVTHSLNSGRNAWIQVAQAQGEVILNGISLLQGDGVAIENEREINLSCRDSAEVLIFDLP